MIFKQLELNEFMIDLWLGLAALAAFGSLVVYFLVRFSSSKGDTGPAFRPNEGRSSALKDVVYVALFLALIGVVTIPPILDFLTCSGISARASSYRIEVRDERGSFRFYYPDYGFTTAGVLAISSGREVRFSLKAEDVAYTFWIPLLSGIVEVLPDQASYFSLKTDLQVLASVSSEQSFASSQPGLRLEKLSAHQGLKGYALDGRCSEYRDDSSVFVPFQVLVLDDLSFRSWIVQQQGRMERF